MLPMSDAIPDPLALPMVAYRGLWDTRCAPGTLDAFRRGFQRGVGSLYRLGRDSAILTEVIKIACQQTANPFRQPLWIMSRYLPSDDQLPARATSLPPLYAVIEGRSNRVWATWSWNGTRWQPLGAWVPIGLSLQGITLADFEHDVAPPDIVLESTSVVHDLTQHAGVATTTDERLLARLLAATGSARRVTRVTDTVELDQLEHTRAEVARAAA